MGSDNIEMALRRAVKSYVLGVKTGYRFNSWVGKPPVAGIAEAIEDAFETAKTELGLAHNETRS